MYKGKRFIAVIPARGGSKGIPNKNIIEVADKPLISYTIEAALKSMYLDRIIVSTDSERIAEISRGSGADVPFLRPEELATDESRTIDTLIHVIKNLPENYDYVVLLQPTQPLRKTIHIDKAIEQIIDKNQQSLVSVSMVKQHPILMRTIDKNGTLQPILNENSTVRRQDFKPIYIVDGSIYINKIDENFTSKTSLNDNLCAYLNKDLIIDIDNAYDLRKFREYVSGEFE
ncbi:cytidylyltransferase domain-containing protein [Lysinibacillus sp. NPDC097231]|uniref:acylneuraminate cytidylyltransferase family protein n=1 Tax=Lysinibacillus sp. NPDC097231 TaxID=3364142 RepID=UPI003818958C